MKHFLLPITLFLFITCQKEEPNQPYAYENVVNGQKISYAYIPSSFTPDGDGLNDTFRPILVGLVNPNFSIYNQNVLLYQSEEFAPQWDGTTNGEELVPNGSYSWKLTATDTTGFVYDLEGILTVIR